MVKGVNRCGQGLEKMDYMVFFPPVGTLQWPDQVWWSLLPFWSLAMGWVLLRHTEKKSVPIYVFRTEGRAFPSKHSVLLLSLPRAAVYSHWDCASKLQQSIRYQKDCCKKTYYYTSLCTMHWISFTCCGSYRLILCCLLFFRDHLHCGASHVLWRKQTVFKLSRQKPSAEYITNKICLRRTSAMWNPKLVQFSNPVESYLVRTCN